LGGSLAARGVPALHYAQSVYPIVTRCEITRLGRDGGRYLALQRPRGRLPNSHLDKIPDGRPFPLFLLPSSVSHSYMHQLVSSVASRKHSVLFTLHQHLLNSPDQPRVDLARDMLLARLDGVQASLLFVKRQGVLHVPPGDRPRSGRVSGHVDLVETKLLEHIQRPPQLVLSLSAEADDHSRTQRRFPHDVGGAVPPLDVLLDRVATPHLRQHVVVARLQRAVEVLADLRQ